MQVTMADSLPFERKPEEQTMKAKGSGSKLHILAEMKGRLSWT
jgi:hypothetical protein